MDRRTFTRLLTVGGGTLSLATAAEGDGGGGDVSVEQSSTKEGQGKSIEGTPDESVHEPDDPEVVNVAGFRALAQKKLPKATYDYISTGSADGITLRENVAAFERMRIAPPLLRGVSEPDLSTTVVGQPIDLPILLAPVAVQRMYHPEGGLAASRAAASAGTIYGVSSSVGNSVEEIAAASNGPKWYQLYMPKDRKVARRLVERVEQAGYKAIILTVDLGEWKDADRRNRFALPKEMLVKHLLDIGFSQISSKMSYEELLKFNGEAWEISLAWDVFAWLRSITKLPLLIKGVLRKEDGIRAVDEGLDGVIVSNHGGRRLDGMPPTIEMLPEVVDAVDGRVDVLLDSGIRRGTDVLKALSLGAKAVLVGRPYAWALAAGGEAGVLRVLELLRGELENAMIATGCQKASDANPSLLI